MKRFLPLPPHGRALCALAALAVLPAPAQNSATNVGDMVVVEERSSVRSGSIIDLVPPPPEDGEPDGPPLQPSGAAARAFRFLAGMQREDGSWPGDPPEMATAWVLLAALYNGWFDEDEWRDSFARGVGFLVGAMREDGSFDAGPFPPGLGEPRAPALALLYAADATRNPRVREAADAAARAAFGTNAPPELFRSLELLSYHPVFGPAFRELREERARALVPTEPRDGCPAGLWTSSPDYGELAYVLPTLPYASLVWFLGGSSNRVTVRHRGRERSFDRTVESESVLATAASLLVPGRMGAVSNRPPFPTAEEVARATAPLDKCSATSPLVRQAALRWLRERQSEDGSWSGGDDPVVDTALALLAFAADDSNLVDRLGVDGLSRTVRFLAASIRDDGSFPVRDRAGDAAALPVLALRAISEASPHPEVRLLLRKAGAEPYDHFQFQCTFAERLLLAWPALPRAERDAFREADLRARRWEVRPERPFERDKGPKLVLHWDEPPTEPLFADGTPLPAAAFRPLPADASIEARALRATTRWLLVPPAGSVRHFLPAPGSATNAPAALLPDGIKVTVRRHAEVAEVSPPGGGSGEAEPPPVESHAESAEAAEFGSPAGGAGEQSEPEGVSHAASAEGAFFLAALERAREIAARAGAECHVRTLYSATRGLEFKRGTQLVAQLTVPNPSADPEKTWLSKATATLYLGLVGTNGVDLADYDDEIRYGEFRKKADANGIVSTGQGTQLCLRPTIRNKCLHWTDGMVYAILQYPVRFEPALFAGLWRETTNAVAGRALSAPPPADIPAARLDDLEEEGARLLPVLTERFAEAGLERIWTCWFVSRAPLYDGSFLRLSSWQGLDNTKNREWWMRMTAHATAPANPERNLAVADLFYGRTDGRPFVLEDYALANRGRTPKIRAWTDGDRFVVLRPYTPRDEDAVWDRFFEITTNVVRGPVFAP